MTTPPRWDMTNVYPSLESKQYKAAFKKYTGLLNELETFFAKQVSKANAKTDPKKLGNLLKQEKTAKGGIHAKQLQAAWNLDYLLKMLASGI